MVTAHTVIRSSAKKLEEHVTGKGLYLDLLYQSTCFYHLS